MKTPFLILGILFLLASCAYRKKPYKLTGRIMLTCDVPAANMDFYLGQGYNTLTGNSGGTFGDFTTDSNGYFSVIYQKPPNHQKIKLGSVSGNYWWVMIDIPVYRNLNLGTINLNPTVNFIVHLKVNNPYTEFDTLYYSNWKYPTPPDIALKLPGPFQSGILDTAVNIDYLKFPLVYGQSTGVYLTYYINTVEDNTIYFDTPLCDSDYSEVTFTID